jgi:hypothetical protein
VVILQHVDSPFKWGPKLFRVYLSHNLVLEFSGLALLMLLDWDGLLYSEADFFIFYVCTFVVRLLFRKASGQ